MQEDYQQIDDDNKPVKSGLNVGQKIAAGVLAVLAVFVLIMWFVQFKKSISEPFEYKSNKSEEEQASVCQGPDCAEDSEESLRAKDTDSDGLSDWDELYFYKTSPYLEDSDSDGFTDKQEIASDNDPNCPIGRDCYGAEIVEGDESVVSDKGGQQDSNPLNNFLPSAQQGNQLSAPAGAESNFGLESLLGGQLDAETLRQLLLQAGMGQDILDQFSDEQLMEAYGKTLKQ